MKIILNNTPETFLPDTMSISGLLKLKNFTFKMLVIKVNGKLIQKTEYDSFMIHAGDEVMVLHLISGG